MKKTLILGLGSSGKAAAKLLENLQVPFFVFDDNIPVYQNWANAEDISFFDPKKEKLEEACNQIVVSPGVPRSHPLYQRAAQYAIPIIGEAELALQKLNQKMVAITGTNGKTTVTFLVEHILRQAGIKAKAVGNSGYALSEYTLNPVKDEVLVVELSSFQLETMHTKKFESAIYLNLTPDHLDRYEGLTEYAETKAHLQNLIKPQGMFFVYEKVLQDFPELFKKGAFISFGRQTTSCLWTDKSYIWEKEEKVCQLAESYRALGWHECENVLAAYALLKPFKLSPKVFEEALATFKKPSHRLEFICEEEGVSYYDDSKGTNIDAVIQAVSSIHAPIVLIAGGVDKGFPYSSWIEPLSTKVKKIITIGASAEKIEKELSHAFSVEKASNMQDAVEKAQAAAGHGDAVLLSPGCASYDMFKDYAHRGQEFQRCVLNLQLRRKSS